MTEREVYGDGWKEGQRSSAGSLLMAASIGMGQDEVRRLALHLGVLCG